MREEGGREGGREGRHYHFVIQKVLDPWLEDSSVVVRGRHLGKAGGREGRREKEDEETKTKMRREGGRAYLAFVSIGGG